jgi:hypothetical protein
MALTTVQQGMVTGGPAFLVKPTTTQAIPHNTVTKITLGTEIYDTNSNFASSTFTPTVAGYYQINCNLSVSNVNTRSYYYLATVHKNGIQYTGIESSNYATPGAAFALAFTSLIPMNGTTDYIEFYIYQYDYTASTTINVQTSTNYSGVLIRGL